MNNFPQQDQMDDEKLLAFLESLFPPMERKIYSRPHDVTVFLTAGGIPVPMHTEVLEEMTGEEKP